MSRDEGFGKLVHEALNGTLSRRDVLRRGALLGLSAPVIAALLAACGGGKSSTSTTSLTGTGLTATSSSSTGVGASPVGSPMGTPMGSPMASPMGSPMSSPSAMASPIGSPSAMTFDAKVAPTVPDPTAAKKYSGQKITYYGDSVGAGNDIDKVLAAQFTKDTGININVVPKPQDSTQNYATYQRFFQGKSTDVDVMMLDVIWPGSFAPHLVDLSQALADEAKLHFDTIIKNDTVDGKLVAMPWFGDVGMMYYRTDLLQKYGYSAPPETWDELEQMATKIKDGEKANSSFQGFVFQGDAYEGLTCDSIEWLASSGGGTIMDANGKVTVNNPAAIKMLNRAKGWIGGIAPRDVTSYQEEDARNVFQGGNAAFMRNWPYAYAEGNASDSPIKGKFDGAPIPADQGQQHYGCVGGWQLGVSAYSKNPDASIEFVRYMTSPQVETWRAVIGSYVPTMASVSADPNVLKAMPFLAKLQNVIRVARPSQQTGANYNQVSTYFFQGVNKILTGDDASSVIPQVQQQIERVIG
ncbi:MAG TPA: extracellular solute-binding protein [Nitrolancea sp.]|jgi:trehalose/maltose transport system substrate-binding protein|nr:extracellular solute-binding protein [Nitrolancea sp.]